MNNATSKIWVNEILKPAGIVIDGNHPWDIKVNDPKFYTMVKQNGSLGLGESYMAGFWDCKKLDEFFYRLLINKIPEKISLSLPIVSSVVFAKLFNLQSKSRAFQIGQKHYDTGNDLFEKMLGKTMAYSCGYWQKVKNLDRAQEDKFDLICKKLNLKARQKILDVGCGWGIFAKYAAKKYGVSVVGITVSKEQALFAREICKGLAVEIRLQDYRDVNEKFDHIVSVGMFEHVGVKNYKTYFKTLRSCLKENGLFLLHTIASSKSIDFGDPWLEKYIFPNSMLPSLKQISQATENLFVIEDVHNFGAYYDKTLLAWHKNFENSWQDLKAKYDQTFYRMWRYYLLMCAGIFRAREIQLYQLVLSGEGTPGGHKSVR